MSFLSSAYFGFFPASALGYFLLPRRGRNLWLLWCSWFFYLCAGPEYLPFLLLTVTGTYLTARALDRRPSKALLAGAVGLFVLALFLFKYLAFAASLLGRLTASLGLDWSPMVPKLLLPAGISFYFFTAMGYLMDVYRAIRLSKGTIRNIRENLFWAFIFNSLGIPVAAGVLYAFGGPLLNPIFAGLAMSFSSVFVVSNALRLKTLKL